MIRRLPLAGFYVLGFALGAVLDAVDTLLAYSVLAAAKNFRRVTGA